MSLFEFQTLYKIFVDFIKTEEEEIKKVENRMNQTNKLTLTNPLSTNLFGNRIGM
jgi:predicted metalloendopeptidase